MNREQKISKDKDGTKDREKEEHEHTCNCNEKCTIRVPTLASNIAVKYFYGPNGNIPLLFDTVGKTDLYDLAEAAFKAKEQKLREMALDPRGGCSCDDCMCKQYPDSVGRPLGSIYTIEAFLILEVPEEVWVELSFDATWMEFEGTCMQKKRRRRVVAQ